MKRYNASVAAPVVLLVAAADHSEEHDTSPEGVAILIQQLSWAYLNLAAPVHGRAVAGSILLADDPGSGCLSQQTDAMVLAVTDEDKPRQIDKNPVGAREAALQRVSVSPVRSCAVTGDRVDAAVRADPSNRVVFRVGENDGSVGGEGDPLGACERGVGRGSTIAAGTDLAGPGNVVEGLSAEIDPVESIAFSEDDERS